MGTPRQVLEAEEEANRILADLEAKGVDAESFFRGNIPETAPVTQEVPKPIEEVKQVVEAPVEQPKVEVAAEQPVEQPQAPQEAPASDNFQQKYSALKGKYDAEVPRFAKENKELKLRLETLENIIAKLGSNATPQINQAPQQAEQPKVAFTPEEEEQYGSDFLHKMQKIAELEASKQTKEVQNQLAKLRWNTFETRLAAKVPDYRELDSDPDFTEWTQQKKYGVKIYDALVDSMARGDENTAAEIMLEYKKSKEVPMPPVMTPSDQAPVSNPMERQVAPPKTTTVAPVPEKRKYTIEQLKKMSDDMIKNRSRYSPQDVDKLQNEIDSAMAEGRVVFA